MRTFHTTFYQAPGRLNVFDEHPFKVIMDYGHNAAAVDAVCQLVARLECKGRRICVVAGPGDRRDEDLDEIGQAAARGNFDHYICRRDDDLRGRGATDVPHRIRDAMIAAGVPAERIQVIPDEQEAMQAGLEMAQRGDILLLFADALARGWKQVVHFRSEGATESLHVTGAHRVPVAGDDAAIRASAATLGEDVSLVRDERGVRLAKESDD